MRFLHWLPLSRKILLGILPLFLVIISVSVMLQNSFQEQEIVEQAQASAYTYADLVRESLVSMMVNNLEVDSTFLVRVNDIQQFDSLRIIVSDLRLRDELLTPERVERRSRKSPLMQAKDTLEAQVLATGQPVFVRVGNRFRGLIPFTATTVCQRCHAVPVGYTLGATDLVVSFERVSRAADENWRRSLLIFVIFSALVITVATVMFRRFVSNPVERLVAASNEISEGYLDHPILAEPASPESRDELLVLASRFDDMRLSLKEKIGELDEANRNLSDRNREMEETLVKLRQAQEELVRSERLATTARLTAQLSHEINNPIHNIQSLLESTLRKLNGNDQARELIKVALEEVSRMAKLTRQMLDFYRGSMVDSKRVPVVIDDLLTEVATMNVETCARQNVAIQVEHPHERLSVMGSRDKLTQVLLNLVLNARDALPAGGTITLRTSKRAGRVLIEVIDTGVGIPPENRDRIFDAFFTTKEELSGVGLGLSVSYGIIQQHGGTITVESEVGRGTTFTIGLPAAEVHHV